MRFITAVLAACVLASAGACASFDPQSDRTLPNPCAGKSIYGQDPLCGAPPP